MTHTKGDAEYKFTEDDILKMFKLTSNDNSICPIVKLSLVLDNEGNQLLGTEDMLKTISLDEDSTLTIENNVGKNTTFDIYIQAETLGKIKSYKHVKVQSIVEQLEVKFATEVNFVKNAAPFFKKELESFNVTTGGKEDDQVLTYTSPEAIDLEDDEIQMSFEIPDLNCKCIEVVQRNNTFEMKIDQSNITSKDNGSYTVKIRMYNEPTNKEDTIITTQVSLQLYITYID